MHTISKWTKNVKLQTTEVMLNQYYTLRLNIILV